MTEHLTDYPVVVEFPVAWGDMDAFAHVNNTVYFRWFEDARIAYFERSGVGEHMRQTRVGPILAKTWCRFRLPLKFPDTVRIGARVQDLGEDRFTMVYRVVSESLDAVAADGEGFIVMYDYQNQHKAPVPPDVRTAIEALESR